MTLNFAAGGAWRGLRKIFDAGPDSRVCRSQRGMVAAGGREVCDSDNGDLEACNVMRARKDLAEEAEER